MPCLILTGHPCSGKTTVAQLLKSRALQHSLIDDVVLINEESACPDLTKNACYESPLSEKQTRAALKSAFDRAVGGSKISNDKKRTLVILDALNYIKGFRYELHCISKSAGERHGILWVLNRFDRIEEWNSNRPSEKAYQPALLQELIQRYEPPDERNRWDKPLFTVDVTPAASDGSSKSEVLHKSVYNMHALSETLGRRKETVPVESVQRKPIKSAFSRAKPAMPVSSNDVTDDNLQPKSDLMEDGKLLAAGESKGTSPSLTSNSSEDPKHAKTLEQQLDEILDTFLLKVQPLKEGISTQQHIAGDANVLQELDSMTQRLVSALASAQNSNTGGKLVIDVKGFTLSMNYRRPVSLTELRRLRKQYLQWVASHPPDDTTDRGIATSFLSYVEAQL